MTEIHGNDKIIARRLCLALMMLVTAFGVPSTAFSQLRENAAVLELPAAENKARLDALITKIDNEVPKRALALFGQGEPLSVGPLDAANSLRVILDGKSLYIMSKGCSDITDVKTWNLFFYPLEVDTSPEVDARRPAINLKSVLLENAVVITDETSSNCISHLELPVIRAYKVEGYKALGGKKVWSFTKLFAESSDYLNINAIDKAIKAIPNESVVCKLATRLCHLNTRKPKYVADLKASGVENPESKENFNDEFYLETRRTVDEIKSQFPKFDLDVVESPRSIIADFISDNFEYNIVISVRDNAIRQFQEADIKALEQVGVDFTNLAVRGAHVAVIRPDMPPINVTDNKNPVTLSFQEHKILGLEIVASAGFAMGDNSTINLKGKNVSPNLRGINIAVIDSKGRLVTAKNFDSHIAPYRSQGLYRGRVIE